MLDHQGGLLLRDDATLVPAQWASAREQRYTSTPSPRGLRSGAAGDGDAVPDG